MSMQANGHDITLIRFQTYFLIAHGSHIWPLWIIYILFLLLTAKAQLRYPCSLGVSADVGMTVQVIICDTKIQWLNKNIVILGSLDVTIEEGRWEGQINIHDYTKRILTKPVHTPTQCVKTLPHNSGSFQTTVTKLWCKFTTQQNMLHAYYACWILKEDPYVRTPNDNWPQTAIPLWWPP